MKPKKVILAFDSFKGCLTSREAGEAAAEGVREYNRECEFEIVALGDGGEGTADVIKHALGGESVYVEVSDPLGRDMTAEYTVCGDRAIIEVASASGLTLLRPDERNPWITTSFGTGMLISDALDKGIRKFVISLGGSATNDAGIGLLQALGFRFIDKKGNEIGRGGGEIEKISKIDLSEAREELKECEFTGLCDVSNPLTGKNGASLIFGAQKGAGQKIREKLDRNLNKLADIVSLESGKDFSDFPGAGAAGGIGFAILSFLNGCLESGIDAVLDIINFDCKLKNADLVFTGEGRIDDQTGMGKAPGGVLKHALRYGIPVVALGGSVEEQSVAGLLERGFMQVVSINNGSQTLDKSMQPDVAKNNIRKTVNKILKESSGIAY